MPLARNAILLVCASILAISCGRGGGDRLSIPETPVFVSECEWLLVKEAYVRVKAATDVASADLGYLKKGDVTQCLAREISTDERRPGHWLKVSIGDGEGWVHSASVAWFESKEKALAAASAP